MPIRSALVLAATLALAAPLAADAAGVDRTEAFVLDKWYDLDVTEGPVTLHRLRVVKQTGPITKSLFVRPGNQQYSETIQFQLEYSNDSTSDWVADLDVALLDSQGAAIDGYHDDEGLGEEERHEQATVTLSTLKYALARAAKLRIKISCEKD
jgi:hypothetical protein